MAFSEELKKDVRDKACFRCCRCQKIGVEVHHILPQKDGGPDIIENAAPLCPSCHADFGDNKEKRKIIKEMRDAWYRRVKEMFAPQDQLGLEEISNELVNIKSHTSEISELKSSVREFLDRKVQEITPSTAVAAVSSIISSTSAFSQQPEMHFRNSVYWVEEDSEPYCSRCWEVESRRVHLHPLGNPAMYQCPQCNSGSVKAKPEKDEPPTARVFYPDPF